MIDWKNWKTGAKIGLIYGIIGMGYFLFLLGFNSQPNSPGQPVLDTSSDISIKLFIIGVLAFLPLFCLSFLTAIIFSPILPAESRMIFLAATLPVYGVLLGAVIGYIFELREKNKNFSLKIP